MSNSNKISREFSAGIGMGAGYAATGFLLGIAETFVSWMVQNPEMREELKEKYYEAITPPEGVVSRVWK